MTTVGIKAVMVLEHNQQSCDGYYNSHGYQEQVVLFWIVLCRGTVGLVHGQCSLCTYALVNTRISSLNSSFL